MLSRTKFKRGFAAFVFIIAGLVAWFTSNLFYTLFWTLLAKWGLPLTEAKMTAYIAANLVPFVLILLVGIGFYFFVRSHMTRTTPGTLPPSGDPHTPVDTLVMRATLTPRAKIIIGTEHPFVSIEPAGVNRRCMARVQIQNKSDAHISNGAVRVTDLDPPDKDHKDFFLKGDISLPARETTLVEVAYYDMGSSVAKPGRSMRLCVPIAPAWYDRLPGTLSLEPHTFYLAFSTLKERALDKVYCRLFVDDNHILYQRP